MTSLVILITITALNKVNYLRQIKVPFPKIFHSSRSLNLLKKGLESPGKVLGFHLHQRVNTLIKNNLKLEVTVARKVLQLSVPGLTFPG